MAILCNDFTFLGKNMSSFKTKGQPKYLFVNFEQDPDVALAMDREMEMGETNRFRTRPNHFYSKWSSTIPLEFDIVKNPCVYGGQEDAIFTDSDIREITKWLTSTHLPQWLKTDKEYNKDGLRYEGYFSNIETFSFDGDVYGLKLSFQCTTPFAYTEDIVNESTISSYGYLTVKNDSDELNDYCYPKIEIHPKGNGDIFICNLSDCKVLQNGTLSGSADFNALVKVVQEYAKLKGYTIKIGNANGSSVDMTPICNNTAFQFYLVDRYGESTKCTSFFLPDTKEYRIIVGGFMYMKAYKDLPVSIDCEKLTIMDDIGRMVTYDKLGISDVDFIYWPRLINGNNSILLSGNCRFVIKHKESRKVGE